MQREARLWHLIWRFNAAFTIAATKDFWERHYGSMEESGRPRFDWSGSHVVREKEIFPWSVVLGGCFVDAGGGISGNVREGAAIAARLFRTWDARDGDGRKGRQANYRGGRSGRGRSLGRDLRIARSLQSAAVRRTDRPNLTRCQVVFSRRD